MAISASLKNMIPANLRRLRSHMLHAWKGDDAHIDRLGPRDFMRRAFRAVVFNGISGDYAEFGCCGGQTFGMAFQSAKLTGFTGKMWAFDSFEGLPPAEGPKDAHPVWVEGDMAISLEDFRTVARSHGIADAQYEAVKGFYNVSLADTDIGRLDRPRDIALAYVDCDLYSSTMDVLKFLLPRLKHGMILAFDDYYCWSQTAISGERVAAHEIFNDHPRFRLLPYMPIGWAGMSFVVEEKSLLGPHASSSGW